MDPAGAPPNASGTALQSPNHLKFQQPRDGLQSTLIADSVRPPGLPLSTASREASTTPDHGSSIALPNTKRHPAAPGVLVDMDSSSERAERMPTVDDIIRAFPASGVISHTAMNEFAKRYAPPDMTAYTYKTKFQKLVSSVADNAGDRLLLKHQRGDGASSNPSAGPEMASGAHVEHEPYADDNEEYHLRTRSAAHLRATPPSPTSNQQTAPPHTLIQQGDSQSPIAPVTKPYATKRVRTAVRHDRTPTPAASDMSGRNSTPATGSKRASTAGVSTAKRAKKDDQSKAASQSIPSTPRPPPPAPMVAARPPPAPVPAGADVADDDLAAREARLAEMRAALAAKRASIDRLEREKAERKAERDRRRREKADRKAREEAERKAREQHVRELKLKLEEEETRLGFQDADLDQRQAEWAESSDEDEDDDDDDDARHDEEHEEGDYRDGSCRSGPAVKRESVAGPVTGEEDGESEEE